MHTVWQMLEADFSIVSTPAVYVSLDEDWSCAVRVRQPIIFISIQPIGIFITVLWGPQTHICLFFRCLLLVWHSFFLGRYLFSFCSFHFLRLTSVINPHPLTENPAGDFGQHLVSDYCTFFKPDDIKMSCQSIYVPMTNYNIHRSLWCLLFFKVTTGCFVCERCGIWWSVIWGQTEEEEKQTKQGYCLKLAVFHWGTAACQQRGGIMGHFIPLDVTNVAVLSPAQSNMKHPNMAAGEG